MQWVIGIDGGGTKTIGWAANLTGAVLGQVEKGAGNYHVTGLPAFVALISDIVEGLAANCHVKISDLKAVSLGLAGADRIRDQQIIVEGLACLGLPCRYLIHSDAKVAMVAGLGKAEGIILIAGTGSIAYGINRQGQVIRAGGWGHLASDEGGGYAIGRQALVRSIRAAEGRDKTTILMELLMNTLGVKNWDEMIGVINAAAMSKAKVASLAPAVAAAAARGDQVAAEILLQAGDELTALVASVISRGFANQDKVPVCLFGGIVRNIPLVRSRLEAALAKKACIVPSQAPPVAGAVTLALEWVQNNTLDND